MTSLLLKAAIVDLGEAVDSIDAIIKSPSFQKTTEKGAIWKMDEGLRAALEEMKKVSAAISNSCVKFALLFFDAAGKVKKLASCDASLSLYSIFDELLSELKAQVLAFVQSFMSSFCCASLSRCLFKSVSKLARGLMHHTKELVTLMDSAVCSTDPAFVSGSDLHGQVTYTAGLITELNGQVQKIPQTNKVAIRRFIMERCSGVKQTLTEFSEYVEQHVTLEVESDGAEAAADTVFRKAVGSMSVKDNDEDDDDDHGDDDDDDDDLEDIPYTEREVAVVRKGVELIGLTLTSLKTSLQVATEVADSIYSPPAAYATDNENEREKETRKEELQPLCDVWVETIVDLSQSIENQVIDFGSELYPPFAAAIDTKVAEQRLALLELLQELLQAASGPQFAAYCSAASAQALVALQLGSARLVCEL